MLPRRDRTAMHWWSRHDRSCLPPSPESQGATGAATRPPGWVQALTRALVTAGVEAPEGHTLAIPTTASQTMGGPWRSHACDGSGAGCSGAA
jgi:hypothetical protein